MNEQPSALMQFSLHAQQALPWLLMLALVCWLGMKASFTQLAGLLVFLTFDLIVFGAFVRLSDSGLGCPDWPGCYAQFSPWNAKADIAAAVAAQGGEHGWVSATKAWIEMIHRYWASFIGMLLIVLLIKAFIAKRRDNTVSLALPTALLIVVIIQGLFGKWTVTFKLMPIVVTTHLLGGLLLLSLLLLLYLRYRKQIVQLNDVASSLKFLCGLSLALVVLQIALGGWTSSNYAALACNGGGNSFPLCQGNVWPAMDFASGFDVSRAMGQTSTGQVITLQALTAIHFVHRHFAYLVTLVVGLFAWRLWRAESLQRYGFAIAATLALQMLLGIATVLFDQPLLLAVAHNAGAALLLSATVAAAYKIRMLLR